MIRPAFSTVACPERTIEGVLDLAEASGFASVEFRTFGVDSTRFACDPALTGPGKFTSMLGERGVDACCLASSVRFDEPIRPPVIGMVISDTERTVREGRRAIDVAAAVGCPFVRVFGFEVPRRQQRGPTVDRIVRRLRMVADHARNTPVRVLLENGGSFPAAEDLIEIVDKTDHQLLGASYSLAAGVDGDDDPIAAVSRLGRRLWHARIGDFVERRPCPLGDGDLPCREFVAALAGSGFDGSLVFDWPRAWFEDLDRAEEVLTPARRRLAEWIGQATPRVGRGSKPHAAAGA